MERFETITKDNAMDIKFCEYDGKSYKSETIFDHHLLIWFIAGESRIIQADKEYIFNAGDIFLVQRNQLSYIFNYPKDGEPHKAVIMHLTKKRLQAFYQQHEVMGQSVNVNKKIIRLKNHPLLTSCFNSLLPYFVLKDEEFPEDIADLKITEALTILHKIEPNIDAVLANFENPYKINLAEFMEKNFMFNMPLLKLSYLTGRSISTFKKDFQKIYGMSPQRWLTQKRLELAYHKIKELKQNPIDVYYETGFENLSHFSFAFKKHFGYSPSKIIV